MLIAEGQIEGFFNLFSMKKVKMNFFEHKIECLVEYSLVSKWNTKSGWIYMVINGNIYYYRRSIYFCYLQSSPNSYNYSRKTIRAVN